MLTTVLVQEGTLHVGDVIVCGDGFGRVRALFDDQGHTSNRPDPSTPVEISGLDVVPTAGETFAATDDIASAREIAEARRVRARDAAQAERQAVTLENLYSKMAEQKVKNLNLIIKADVQGSIEALTKELEKLENAEVPIRVLLKGVGGISESDVLLADASQAIVIGFRVAPEDRAITLAEEKNIEIRRYDIIYQVTDDIKKAVEGLLVPEIKEVHLGRAVVRQVFKISKVGAVAGCFVTQGIIERASKVRLIREGREIYKGAIEALKRFKDDVKEVPQNFECGIKIANFDDIKADDVIEAYRSTSSAVLSDRIQDPASRSRRGRRAQPVGSAARRGHSRSLSRPVWRLRTACCNNQIPPGQRGRMVASPVPSRLLWSSMPSHRVRDGRSNPRSRRLGHPLRGRRSPDPRSHRPARRGLPGPPPGDSLCLGDGNRSRAQARPPRAQARRRLFSVPGRGSAANPFHARSLFQARRQREEVRRDQPPDRRGHCLRSQARPSPADDPAATKEERRGITGRSMPDDEPLRITLLDPDFPSFATLHRTREPDSRCSHPNRFTEIHAHGDTKQIAVPDRRSCPAQAPVQAQARSVRGPA